MGSGGAGKPRLLFVLSRDFGELTNAVCFVLEQDFDSLFLVPPALGELTRTGLPVPVQPYASVHEVLTAVDRFAPDMVLLFCGYLYANNGIFSIEQLEELVRALPQRGCRVVTSDPFLGVLAHVDESSFTLVPQLRSMVVAQFERAHAILKPLPHLSLIDVGEAATSEVVAFSNPRFYRPRAYLPCPNTVQQALGLDPARPRWVFVLAAPDYLPYTEFDGVPFDELLTDQMYEALHQGRQPVLVAPRACTQSVAIRGCTSDGLVLLPFCQHDHFLSLLLDAEYVFYWNLFSISALVRIMSRLPVFFFDRGHMARDCPPLFPRGLQGYYLGEEPSYLSLTEPLDADQLAHQATQQERQMNAVADNLLKSPPPAEVVRRLLAAG